MKDLLEAKIQEYFKVKETTSKEILNQLTLFVYQSSKDNDLYLLAKILPDDHLKKVISYFDGAVVRFPKKDEYDICMLMSIIFFLHEVELFSWNKIKGILKDNNIDLDFVNSISVGKRLAKIRKELKVKMKNLIKEMSLTDINDVLNTELESLKKK